MGVGLAKIDGCGLWPRRLLGTSARHCPAIDLTVVGAVTNNAARPALAETMAAAIRLMAAAIARGP